MIAIKTTDTVLDSSATTFAGNFYKFLLKDRLTIREAYLNACRSIKKGKRGENFLLLPSHDEHDVRLEDIFEVTAKPRNLRAELVTEIFEVPHNVVDFDSKPFLTDGENVTH